MSICYFINTQLLQARPDTYRSDLWKPILTDISYVYLTWHTVMQVAIWCQGCQMSVCMMNRNNNDNVFQSRTKGANTMYLFYNTIMFHF